MKAAFKAGHMTALVPEARSCQTPCAPRVVHTCTALSEDAPVRLKGYRIYVFSVGTNAYSVTMSACSSTSKLKIDARSQVSGLVWGSVGVLAFSVSLPATRLAVAGGLAGSFVGIGRAAVAGALALLTLAIMRQPLPSVRLIPRLAVVAVGVVLGFHLLTSLALTHVPASHGIVVAGLLPAATAVMAVFRSGERPSLRFWIAVLAGVAFVLTFAVVQGGGSVQRADALLLAAVLLCGSGYAEGRALARELGGVQVICLALVLSLPITVPITLGPVENWLSLIAAVVVQAPKGVCHGSVQSDGCAVGEDVSRLPGQAE
jgi:drug/metabolite transporter (DMT)-like permease